MSFYKLLPLLLVFFACSSGYKMRCDNYCDVNMGMREANLVKLMGKPDAIKKINVDEKEYIYYEKIFVDDRIIEVKKYIIKIRKGKIISKRIETKDESQKVFERNAYDLQSS